MIRKIFQKHWFMIGLLVVLAVVLADSQGVFVRPGKWLKAHHGPDMVIAVIFFFSGLMLNVGLLQSGLLAVKETLLAFIVIFVASPLMAAGLCLLPLATGIKIGLLLVAVMPCTLTSGVVMTGVAGGNMAHALVVTIGANMLAVFSIPVVLSWGLTLTGNPAGIMIEKLALIRKIALLVLLPLTAGLLLKQSRKVQQAADRRRNVFQGATLFCVLMIVFMAAAKARPTVVANIHLAGAVVLLVAVFHLVLLGGARGLCRMFAVGPGKRESVLFMGAQKTLPLSVLLQTTIFPEFGAALLVCVLHHLIHLLIDGYVAEKMRESGSS